MANRSVAIVHLGRAGGLGTHRRVESLAALFETAGADVVDVALRADHPARAPDLLLPSLGALASGSAVPEVLAWSQRGVQRALRRLAPHVVVCVTGRAYHPELLSGPWHLVLDYVDRLSVSYRDRARILGPSGRALAYYALARAAARQERRTPRGVTAIAAGWTDARALGATWVPITVASPTELSPATPDHDVVFFGTLSYEPNVEALRRLARLWPLVVAARANVRMLVAGATPTTEVRTLADQFGWTLLANVPDARATLRRARVAVAPLRHASGLQIKVLEAAASNVAQVVDPVVLGGFSPGFPAAVASEEPGFAHAVVTLLENETERRELADRARLLVAREYSVARWTGWAGALLSEGPPR